MSNEITCGVSEPKYWNTKTLYVLYLCWQFLFDSKCYKNLWEGRTNIAMMSCYWIARLFSRPYSSVHRSVFHLYRNILRSCHICSGRVKDLGPSGLPTVVVRHREKSERVVWRQLLCLFSLNRFHRLKTGSYSKITHYLPLTPNVVPLLLPGMSCQPQVRKVASRLHSQCVSIVYNIEVTPVNYSLSFRLVWRTMADNRNVCWIYDWGDAEHLG